MSTGKFDLVQIAIGYAVYAMPEKAAFAIFEALRGADTYRIDSKYENGKSVYYARLLSTEECPSLKTMGPVQFHTMREAHRMMEEAEEAKSKAT